MRTRLAAAALLSIASMCFGQADDTVAREAHRLRQDAEALLARGEDLAHRGHEREAAEAFEEAAELIRRADQMEGDLADAGRSQSQVGPEPIGDRVIQMANRIAELGDERTAERVFQEARRYSEERERLMVRVQRAQRAASTAESRNRADQAERFGRELDELRVRLADLDDSLEQLEQRAGIRLQELESQLPKQRADPRQADDLAADRQRHVREAVEHLHAAGMPDLARLVEREGWEQLHLDPRNPHTPHDRPGTRQTDGEIARRTEVLTDRVERLEIAIYEMRRTIEQVARDMRRDRRTDVWDDRPRNPDDRDRR